jgi:hypothetical protein
MRSARPAGVSVTTYAKAAGRIVMARRATLPGKTGGGLPLLVVWLAFALLIIPLAEPS